MYIRFSSLLPVAALAAVVAAAPNALEARWGSSECDTGSIEYCCQTTTQASSSSATAILGLLGIVLQDLTQLVGLNCSPLQVLGSTSCSQQPVCCNGNDYSGLIVIGCSPINVNL